MLPMPATSTSPLMRNLPIHCHWFNLVGSEKETMPRLAEHPEIAPGIVLQYDGKMHLVVVVAFNGLDNRDLAFHGHVHDVCGLLRPQAHAISGPDLDAEDGDARKWRVLRRVRVPEVGHGHGSLTGRRLRMAPCVRISCSR